MEQNKFSYSNAGIDISHTDNLKKNMAGLLTNDDSRVLNGLGPFASLYDISFPQIKNPVLVLKSEEPGSKQKLAMEFDCAESVCHDMINHLVNDIAVMGATPLAVLDTIVCGTAESDVILKFIKGMRDACKNNECALVGGETSVQPLVVDNGLYVLTSSIAGIIEKDQIIDGHKISEGDVVLSVASNGVHTNGYTLIRMLMDSFPEIKEELVDGETFVSQIMKPHTPYYRAIKHIFGIDGVHGMAHITGGGIAGNLCRVMPEGLSAEIDLDKIKVLPLFSFIQQKGNISEDEMLNTFNCGVGLNIVVSPECKDQVIEIIGQYYDCYEIGTVKKGSEKVTFINHLNY